MTSPRSSGRDAEALLRALGSSTSCIGLGLEGASSLRKLLMAGLKRITIVRRASVATKMALQVPLENPDQAVQGQGIPAIAVMNGVHLVCNLTRFHPFAILNKLPIKISTASRHCLNMLSHARSLLSPISIRTSKNTNDLSAIIVHETVLIALEGVGSARMDFPLSARID